MSVLRGMGQFIRQRTLAIMCATGVRSSATTQDDGAPIADEQRFALGGRPSVEAAAAAVMMINLRCRTAADAPDPARPVHLAHVAGARVRLYCGRRLHPPAAHYIRRLSQEEGTASYGSEPDVGAGGSNRGYGSLGSYSEPVPGARARCLVRAAPGAALPAGRRRHGQRNLGGDCAPGGHGRHPPAPRGASLHNGAGPGPCCSHRNNAAVVCQLKRRLLLVPAGGSNKARRDASD